MNDFQRTLVLSCEFPAKHNIKKDFGKIISKGLAVRSRQLPHISITNT